MKPITLSASVVCALMTCLEYFKRVLKQSIGFHSCNVEILEHTSDEDPFDDTDDVSERIVRITGFFYGISHVLGASPSPENKYDINPQGGGNGYPFKCVVSVSDFDLHWLADCIVLEHEGKTTAAQLEEGEFKDLNQNELRTLYPTLASLL